MPKSDFYTRHKRHKIGNSFYAEWNKGQVRVEKRALELIEIYSDDPDYTVKFVEHVIGSDPKRSSLLILKRGG